MGSIEATVQTSGGSGGAAGSGNLAEQAGRSARLLWQQPILDAVLGEIGMKGGDLNSLVDTVRKEIAPDVGVAEG